MSERAQRVLSVAENWAMHVMYERKRRHCPTSGYVTAALPIPMGSKDGQGPWGPNPERIIPPGQTLKIVMASRMGDAGLTDDLTADYGYHVRLDWEDAAMSNIRLTQ